MPRLTKELGINTKSRFMFFYDHFTTSLNHAGSVPNLLDINS